MAIYQRCYRWLGRYTHHPRGTVVAVLLIVIIYYLSFVSTYLMPASLISSLPRNQGLTAFNPYRPTFDCKIEATVVPPIDAEAQAWFDEALFLTSTSTINLDGTIKFDYPKAVWLYEKAAAKQHWKAMLNLASLYLNGADGVDIDTERGVKLVEAAMRLGIPSAYDLMGTLHMNGQGVNQSADRAYAFWQLAADRGSASAQAFLGRSLSATYTQPGGIWANPIVGFKMMQCSAVQGNAKGCEELGAYYFLDEGHEYSTGDHIRDSAEVLHHGVKNGASECASSISARSERLFESSEMKERQRRYDIFESMLFHNPNFYRFPNLDKALPLPSTRLPKFKNDAEMVNAAKGVQYPLLDPSQSKEGAPVFMSHPRVTYGLDREIPRQDTAPKGFANPAQPVFADPRLSPIHYLTSPGDQPCPQAGIWRVTVPDTHPLAHVINRTWSAPNQAQAYLQKGQAFPDPKQDWFMDGVSPAQMTWWLLEPG